MTCLWLFRGFAGKASKALFKVSSCSASAAVAHPAPTVGIDMIGGAGAPLRASSFLCFHVPPVNKSGLVDARAQRDRWVFGVVQALCIVTCGSWVCRLCCKHARVFAYGIRAALTNARGGANVMCTVLLESVRTQRVHKRNFARPESEEF